METVVGIFSERKAAEAAMKDLRGIGLNVDDIVLLTPGSGEEKLRCVPTEDAEQPGMGKAIGGVAGGAVGLGGGALAASFFLPGVGSILALGLGAGALGIGGAVAGSAAGDLFENLLTRGLPKDEIFLYEDALAQGRTVLLALSEEEDLVERGQAIMQRAGAESVDAARKKWWIGLRDAEAAEYDARHGSFNDDEQAYRCGFEAALDPQCRGRSWPEAKSLIEASHGSLCDHEAFRHGYERGQRYYAERHNNHVSQR
jgi:hypothetical protein